MLKFNKCPKYGEITVLIRLMAEIWCSRHDFTYTRGWMQMVTSTKWFIFLKQEYSEPWFFYGDILHTLCYSFVQCTATLTLCITASWSCGRAVFCVLGHLAVSSLLHCPEPTAAHYPSLGDWAPLSPKWHPFSQDPPMLPPHGSEHLVRISSSWKVVEIVGIFFGKNLIFEQGPNFFLSLNAGS